MNRREIEPVAPGTSEPTWDTNIGAVCVQIPAGKSEGRIRNMVDTTSANVSFSWYWLDRNWVEVGHVALQDDPQRWLLSSGPNHGGGCDRGGASPVTTPWLKKPKGAKYFYVFVHEPARNCTETDGATVGTVTLQFR